MVHESRKLALITGASSGIGRAYAQRLARDGWDLAVVARRRDRLEALAAELTTAHGCAVDVIAADLADAAQLQSLVSAVSRMPLSLLVNNAGLGHYMPFLELPPGIAQELVSLNVLAPTLLCRAALPGMVQRGDGAVVNVASLLAYSGPVEPPNLPRRAVYSGTKAYLVTFTQILARELDGTAIRAQVVCPGVVRTEFHDRQGIDMSGAPRMEPESVVEASLRGLDLGEVVCIPGAEDLAALERIAAAQRDLMRWTRQPQAAARYRSG